MLPIRRPGDHYHSVVLPNDETIDVYTDDDGNLVTGGSEGRPPRLFQEIWIDTLHRMMAAARQENERRREDLARRARHKGRHPRPARPRPARPSDAATTTQSPPIPSTQPSDAASTIQPPPLPSTVSCSLHNPNPSPTLQADLAPLLG
ncbi:hypothetical protein VPH35_074217 [Triticum aestivum]